VTDSSRLRPTLKESRAGIVLTTFALVALASAGTGILVSHSAKQLTQQPRTTATTAARAPQLPTVAPPVLVDRAPGTFVLPPAARPPPPAPHPQHPAPQPPRPRALGPVALPPVVEPPLVEPPVVEPPVLEPPVLEPPVLEPPVLEPPFAPRLPSFSPHVTWPDRRQATPHSTAPDATSHAANPHKPAHPAHPSHPTAAQDPGRPGHDHGARPDAGQHNGQGKQRD
jgi:hypothetical protein